MEIQCSEIVPIVGLDVARSSRSLMDGKLISVTAEESRVTDASITAEDSRATTAALRFRGNDVSWRKKKSGIMPQGAFVP